MSQRLEKGKSGEWATHAIDSHRSHSRSYLRRGILSTTGSDDWCEAETDVLNTS
jgi:hypothetical protein